MVGVCQKTALIEQVPINIGVHDAYMILWRQSEKLIIQHLEDRFPIPPLLTVAQICVDVRVDLPQSYSRRAHTLIQSGSTTKSPISVIKHPTHIQQVNRLTSVAQRHDKTVSTNS